MSRIITSPVKRYPGTVTLPDPMTWDQLSKWGDFVGSMGRNTYDNVHSEALFIPSFVEKIDIKDFPTNMDAPPKHLKEFSALMDWVIGGVLAVIDGDEITPFFGRRLYNWLEGGDTLPEVEALLVCNRFGLGAISPLTPRLARRLVLIERAQIAYYSRKNSSDWVEWADKNKDANELLLWLVRCEIAK